MLWKCKDEAKCPIHHDDTCCHGCPEERGCKKVCKNSIDRCGYIEKVVEAELPIREESAEITPEISKAIKELKKLKESYMSSVKDIDGILEYLQTGKNEDKITSELLRKLIAMTFERL
jgi:hypothetical protein